MVFSRVFSEKTDEEFAILRGEVVDEYCLLYQWLERLIGVFLELAGDPFDRLAQIFSIRDQATH